MRDQALTQGHTISGGAGGRYFDLHLRHVDGHRAFTLAGLAADAELHGLGHLIRGQCVRAKLTGQGKAERVGSSAGQVALVTGRPVGRAHRTARELPASAVVVAHLDCAMQLAGPG